MAKWKREALQWYDHDSVVWDGMYDEVKKNIVSPLHVKTCLEGSSQFIGQR